MTTAPSLPPLPVPPLQQSLDRYLDALRPLLSDAEFQRTSQVVAAFAVESGPACQRALEDFAATQYAAGSSWLADAWLESYLATRTPLPLTSNVGWLINWPGSTTGIERAADFLHRISAVHLAHLRGELPLEQTARGQAVDPRQRRYLDGGIRAPHPGSDVTIPGPASAVNRDMVVLWRGQPYAVPVSDEAGVVVGNRALLDALTHITTQKADRDDFALLSYLGSEQLASQLPQLLADAENAATYQRLTNSLFVVNLSDRVEGDDEFLARITFQEGAAWAYKTMSYQISLASGQIGTHMEHSTVDGATLKNVIKLAQEITPVPAAERTLTVAELPWGVTGDFGALLVDLRESCRRVASEYQARTVQVPLTIPETGVRISTDALAQLVMLYAQVATFGQVRSTYEAVDMREYQAGRTECLRPNSAAAVAFVQDLRDGSADLDGLQAALADHKQWVKWCKTGQAVDRHLYGLGMMAQQLGFDPVVQNDPGYQRLTTDFLSTSSLGDPHQLIRFAFAPTSAGGLGISYSAADGVFEFCVNWREDERGGDIEAFIENLDEAGTRLGVVFASAQ